MKWLGVFLIAFFIPSCSYYRKSTERHFAAVAKREFKQLESSTGGKCTFDYSVPSIVPDTQSSYSKLRQIVYYQKKYPSQIIHEMSHHYLAGSDRDCMSEMISELIYENYKLKRKVHLLEIGQ